jgi:hypothetical protein
MRFLSCKLQGNARLLGFTIKTTRAMRVTARIQHCATLP